MTWWLRCWEAPRCSSASCPGPRARSVPTDRLTDRNQIWPVRWQSHRSPCSGPAGPPVQLHLALVSHLLPGPISHLNHPGRPGLPGLSPYRSQPTKCRCYHWPQPPFPVIELSLLLKTYEEHLSSQTLDFPQDQGQEPTLSRTSIRIVYLNWTWIV